MSGESAFDAEMAKKDLETIKAFWGEDGSKRCMGNRWSWWVEIARERQLQKRQEMVWQRRRQKLKERNESLYEIPEEAMKWLHEVAEVRHTLDYTRRGRTATVQCSGCGGKAEYLFEPVTLEDMARAASAHCVERRESTRQPDGINATTKSRSRRAFCKRQKTRTE